MDVAESDGEPSITRQEKEKISRYLDNTPVCIADGKKRDITRLAAVPSRTHFNVVIVYDHQRVNYSYGTRNQIYKELIPELRGNLRLDGIVLSRKRGTS